MTADSIRRSGPPTAHGPRRRPTTPLNRRNDLINDKSKVIISYFAFKRKDPAEVIILDVKEWQAKVEEQGITTSTVRC
jgi:hypothetical protein